MSSQPSIDTLVANLKAGTPEETMSLLKALRMFIRNVQKNPTEESYRRINLQNDKFQKRVWRHDCGKHLMFAIGWKEQNGFLVLETRNRAFDHAGELLEKLLADPSDHIFKGCQSLVRVKYGDFSKAEPSELNGKVIALYFSAHWCGPCRQFTPILRDFYDEVKDAGGNLEIVFVSSDRSPSDMLNYMKSEHGDWLGINFHDQTLVQNLKKQYGVRGIPKLVVIKPDGTVINDSAREQVQQMGPAAFAGWK